MATYTPNLNLKKPDYTDLADVADFNANMDIIDGLTKELAELVSTLSLEIDEKAIKYTASGTLTAEGWTGTEAPYSQQITVSGITSDDEPNYDVVLSGTYETDVAREADWANVYRLVTSTDTLTFYAHSIPEVDLPFHIWGAR